MWSWEDKLSIIRSREVRSAIRALNIGIGDDLTERQSQVLRDLRADGKKGYFRGTRLVIIKDGTPPQQDDSNNLQERRRRRDDDDDDRFDDASWYRRYSYLYSYRQPGQAG
nr:hypothetical protein BaRGS_006230 [Batillaria attramentaria]